MPAKKKRKLSIGQRIQRFWRETVGELRKVTWPTPPEAWKMTRMVLISNDHYGTAFGRIGPCIFAIDCSPGCYLARLAVSREGR